MRRTRHLARVALVLLCAAAAASACSDSTAERLRAAGLAENCTINSDCNEPLICAFARCHSECSSTRDCPPGARCVQTDGGPGVCQLNDEVECESFSDCPAGQFCAVDNECRNPCSSNSECLGGQTCATSACADPEEVDLEGNLIGGADASTPPPDTGPPDSGAGTDGSMDASADTGTEASTDAAVDTGPDVVSCPVGFDSCGANPSACETDIRTVQNCGVCGNICESTNGTPACTSGQCGIQCTSGFGDCNAGPGCETFLTSDNDCGACGRTCQGLTCVGGACPLTVLLDQGSTIEHCEVAGTRIAYRVQGVDIRSIPLAGGSQTNLVQTLGSAGFTADGSTLFFADAPPTIRQAPLAGGVNTPFTSASVFPDFMVHDSSNVYWASAISIELSPKTAPSTLLFVAGTASNIRGLAAFGGTLYWTDDADGSTDGMVKRGPSTVLATDTEPRKIAGDSFAVYWTNQQPAPNGRVERFTLPSGPQTTLAAGDEPFDIAENAEFIYYTTESAVMRVRKDGSTPAIPIQIGSGFRWICGFDSAHIIYTTGGRIELLAK